MPNTQQGTPPARHRWFDDWRGAQGSALAGLVTEIRSAVVEAEQQAGARQRKRRPVDDQNHTLAVEVVVSNLAHAVLMPPETGRLAIQTRNADRGRSRYDNPALGKPLRTLLYWLDETRLLDLRGEGRRGEASSIAPTEMLARQVSSLGIGLGDFRRLPKEETILLSRKSRQPWSPIGSTVSRSLIDYPETAETTAMRDRLASVNSFVEGGDIGFIEDGRGLVDVHDRVQRRYFSTWTEGSEVPIFDRAGRFFGGFWQNLKSDRRGSIRVEGEVVADLDFSSLYPRLAFASVGFMPPDGDLYAIPGLEGHRDAVKRAMNCLLMDDFARRQWPTEIAEAMPAGWTVAKMRNLILRHHPSLSSCLGVGLGLRLMKTESDILLTVMEEMKSRRIIGLGLHDGLMVASPRAEEARTIMERVGMNMTSIHLPVVRKL